MLKIDLWNRTNRRGYRRRLSYLPAYLTRSVYGKTQQIRLAWYVKHATRQVGCQRRPMRDGPQGRV